jgi:hypothetical protein
MQAVFVLEPQAVTASPNSSNLSGDQNGMDANGNNDDTGKNGKDGDAASSSRSADGTSHTGKPGHWEPSGMAKITAMYRSAEKLSAEEAAANGEHLSVLG